MFPDKHSERRRVLHTVVRRMSSTNSTETSQAFQHGNCSKDILMTLQKNKKGKLNRNKQYLDFSGMADGCLSMELSVPLNKIFSFYTFLFDVS